MPIFPGFSRIPIPVSFATDRTNKTVFDEKDRLHLESAIPDCHRVDCRNFPSSTGFRFQSEAAESTSKPDGNS